MAVEARFVNGSRESAQAFLTEPGRRQAVFDRVIRAAPLVSPTDRTLNVLAQPQHVFQEAIRLGDRTLMAARVQDNDVLARYGARLGMPGLSHKGGLRFHETVTAAKLQELGFEMTLKNAVIAPDDVDFETGARLYMGGGKGGVRVNPKDLSIAELIDLTSAAGRFLAPPLFDGETIIDCPAPDVNTGGLHMRVLLDEARAFTRRPNLAAVYTGKRLEDGGIAVRDEATARGGFIVLGCLLKHMKGEEGRFKNMRVAIDGFGNAGTFMARILAGAGARVMAFSDSQGAVAAEDESGFSPAQIESYIRLKEAEARQKRSLFERNARMSREQLLAADVDLLVLASPNMTLTDQNAAAVRAKFVLESGNGMTSSEADTILFANRVIVIPDILANAGGVMVSGYEYLQGLEMEAAANAGQPRVWWVPPRVIALMEEQMVKAAQAVNRIAADKNVPLRTATDARALTVLDRAVRVVHLGEAI